MRVVKLLLLALALVFGLASVSDAYQRAGFVGRSAPAGAVYDVSANNLFDAMDVKPSASRKREINRLIVDLKEAGVWPKLDMLQVYAAHDSQAARVDWVNPSRVATAVNSPTFTTDRGFNGDGATSYVDTNYNPTSGPNYAQDDASVGIYQLDTTSGNNIIGARDGVNDVVINTRSLGGFYNIRINDTSNDSTSISTALGFSVADRLGTAKTRYKNGVVYGSPFTRSSTGVPNTTVKAGTADVSSFSAGLCGAVYAGGSLTSAEHLALYQALQTYMTAVGAI